MQLLAGTDDGLYQLADGEARRIGQGRVDHLAVATDGTVWAIVDEAIARLADGSWETVELALEHEPRSLLPARGTLLVGTAAAHLYVAQEGGARLVGGFEEAEGRARWHTPWGGPPDTRSLARGVDGTLYANVHVGGVLRSIDAERWAPTMDIGADVHQVAAHPTLAGCALVASAWGLGITFDAADEWAFTDDGLHNSYCRAVAATDDFVLITASDGPRGGRGAVYRRPLRADGPFERCRSGLPEWFEGNVDTGCLVAFGASAALSTADGAVFVSDDAGATWQERATGLPQIRAVAARPG